MYISSSYLSVLDEELYMAIDIAGGKPPFAMVRTVGTSRSRLAHIAFNFDEKPFTSSPSFAAIPAFPPSTSGACSVGSPFSGVVVLVSMIGGEGVISIRH
jgi:hypothetical protein